MKQISLPGLTTRNSGIFFRKQILFICFVHLFCWVGDGGHCAPNISMAFNSHYALEITAKISLNTNIWTPPPILIYSASFGPENQHFRSPQVILMQSQCWETPMQLTKFRFFFFEKMIRKLSVKAVVHS